VAWRIATVVVRDFESKRDTLLPKARYAALDSRLRCDQQGFTSKHAYDRLLSCAFAVLRKTHPGFRRTSA
jgi:hypothetical protein